MPSQTAAPSDISIVVPTYRRPDALARLLGELRAQVAGLEAAPEILVVDNCPDRSAAEVVAGFGDLVRYVPEPAPGVSRARNAGVSAAKGRYIIFIDDDQVPKPGWLKGYREIASRGYAACFGPIEAKFETSPADPLRTILLSLFQFAPALQDGANVSGLRAYLRTGNSMFDRTQCFVQPDPFDHRFNSGGEDVWLFRVLVLEMGIRLTWCQSSAVSEAVPSSRMTARYLLRRKFRNGQLRCLIEARGGGWGAVVVWMCAGAIQFVVHGLVASLLWFTDRNRAFGQAARAAGGLGKVLWPLGMRDASQGYERSENGH